MRQRRNGTGHQAGCHRFLVKKRHGIPTFGQMILGFTLPFALAFVAIPLEYLINSGRIILGAVLVQLLRGAAFVMRLISNLVRETGKLLIAFYDILIFVPLAIERWVAW